MRSETCAKTSGEYYIEEGVCRSAADYLGRGRQFFCEMTVNFTHNFLYIISS